MVPSINRRKRTGVIVWALSSSSDAVRLPRVFAAGPVPAHTRTRSPAPARARRPPTSRARPPVPSLVRRPTPGVPRPAPDARPRAGVLLPALPPVRLAAGPRARARGRCRWFRQLRARWRRGRPVAPRGESPLAIFFGKFRQFVKFVMLIWVLCSLQRGKKTFGTVI